MLSSSSLLGREMAQDAVAAAMSAETTFSSKNLALLAPEGADSAGLDRGLQARELWQNYPGTMDSPKRLLRPRR